MLSVVVPSCLSVIDVHSGCSCNMSSTGDSTRLYWADSMDGRQAIISVTVNGRHRRVLLNELSHNPVGLTIMSDRIYWAYFGNSKIMSANKMTGSDMKTVYDYTGHSIGDMYVFSTNYTTPTNRYPCRHGTHPCSHLCLPNRSNRGYQCACATGVRIEGNTCNQGMLLLLCPVESLIKKSTA